MATGRTVSKWFNFVIEDSGTTIRDLAVYTISVVGVVYEEQDLTALADQVKGAMSNMPDAPIEITGPFSNKAAVAASGTGAAAAYTVDPATMVYSAKFVLFPGSALPAWGTGAET
ncbi:hypothetical protein LCGC14_2517950 [marine sediment metagenome]|uniref:Uncharacterized protein n=1 Tax=marine sediment metagenome TaxID=412755 RepID=A0A0F9AX99_9ZZZZ